MKHPSCEAFSTETLGLYLKEFLGALTNLSDIEGMKNATPQRIAQLADFSVTKTTAKMNKLFMVPQIFSQCAAFPQLFDMILPFDRQILKYFTKEVRQCLLRARKVVSPSKIFAVSQLFESKDPILLQNALFHLEILSSSFITILTRSGVSDEPPFFAALVELVKENKGIFSNSFAWRVMSNLS